MFNASQKRTNWSSRKEPSARLPQRKIKSNHSSIRRAVLQMQFLKSSHVPSTKGCAHRTFRVGLLRRGEPVGAGFRIDFPEWLSRLSSRDRRIAESLSIGNSTQAVAQAFRVSPGRIAEVKPDCHKSTADCPLRTLKSPFRRLRRNVKRLPCFRIPAGKLAIPGNPAAESYR